MTSKQAMRVIFAGSSVGAGHNQAAKALLAGLQQARPDLPAEFVDTLEHVGKFFRACYRGGYSFGVSKLPNMYARSFRLLDRPQGPRRQLGERLRARWELAGARPFRDYLLARRPALVMASHFLPMQVAGHLIEQGVSGLELWVLATDYVPHRFWYGRNVSRYFVPNELVRDRIISYGLPPDRVIASGIPVHPKWMAPLDRSEICRQWKLPEDRPIVLLSGGAAFTVGDVPSTAAALLKASNAHVVVLCGSNKKLLDQLAAVPEAGVRLTGVPFTDRVHELVEVATIIVTKAGGLTVSECMAKGSAMVLSRGIPGQEEGNARMLASAGAAVLAPDGAAVVAQVRHLLDHPELAAQLRANARRLYKPANETITKAIVDRVSHAS